MNKQGDTRPGEEEKKRESERHTGTLRLPGSNLRGGGRPLGERAGRQRARPLSPPPQTRGGRVWRKQPLPHQTPSGVIITHLLSEGVFARPPPGTAQAAAAAAQPVYLPVSLAGCFSFTVSLSLLPRLRAQLCGGGGAAAPLLWRGAVPSALGTAPSRRSRRCCRRHSAE